MIYFDALSGGAPRAPAAQNTVSSSDATNAAGVQHVEGEAGNTQAAAAWLSPTASTAQLLALAITSPTGGGGGAHPASRAQMTPSTPVDNEFVRQALQESAGYPISKSEFEEWKAPMTAAEWHDVVSRMRGHTPGTAHPSSTTTSNVPQTISTMSSPATSPQPAAGMGGRRQLSPYEMNADAWPHGGMAPRQSAAPTTPTPTMLAVAVLSGSPAAPVVVPAAAQDTPASKPNSNSNTPSTALRSSTVGASSSTHTGTGSASADSCDEHWGLPTPAPSVTHGASVSANTVQPASAVRPSVRPLPASTQPTADATPAASALSQGGAPTEFVVAHTLPDTATQAAAAEASAPTTMQADTQFAASAQAQGSNNRNVRSTAYLSPGFFEFVPVTAARGGGQAAGTAGPPSTTTSSNAAGVPPIEEEVERAAIKKRLYDIAKNNQMPLPWPVKSCGTLAHLRLLEHTTQLRLGQLTRVRDIKELGNFVVTMLAALAKFAGAPRTAKRYQAQLKAQLLNREHDALAERVAARLLPPAAPARARSITEELARVFVTPLVSRMSKELFVQRVLGGQKPPAMVFRMINLVTRLALGWDLGWADDDDDDDDGADIAAGAVPPAPAPVMPTTVSAGGGAAAGGGGHHHAGHHHHPHHRHHTTTQPAEPGSSQLQAAVAEAPIAASATVVASEALLPPAAAAAAPGTGGGGMARRRAAVPVLRAGALAAGLAAVDATAAATVASAAETPLGGTTPPKTAATSAGSPGAYRLGTQPLPAAMQPRNDGTEHELLLPVRADKGTNEAAAGMMVDTGAAPAAEEPAARVSTPQHNRRKTTGADLLAAMDASLLDLQTGDSSVPAAASAPRAVERGSPSSRSVARKETAPQDVSTAAAASAKPTTSSSSSSTRAAKPAASTGGTTTARRRAAAAAQSMSMEITL